MPGGYFANNGTPGGRPHGGSSSMPLPVGEFTTITGRPAPPDRNGEGGGFRDELQGVARERDELQGAVISLTQALKRAEATAQHHEKASSFPGSNSLVLAVTAQSVLGAGSAYLATAGGCDGRRVARLMTALPISSEQRH